MNFELTAKIIKFYDIYYTELRVLEQSGAAVQTGPLKLLQATGSLHQLHECAPVCVHLHAVLHSVLVLRPFYFSSLVGRGCLACGFREQGGFYYILVLFYFTLSILIYYVNFV